MPYIELHARSAFSFLEGASLPRVAHRRGRRARLSNLDALLAHLSPLARGVPVQALDLAGTLPRAMRGALLINATSSGLRREDPAPADLAALAGIGAVYDMIYNPPLTRLLAQAKALGLRHSGGLGMLVHQGAKSLEIWSGIAAPGTAPAMRAAAAKALGY